MNMQSKTPNLASQNSNLGYGDYVRFRDLVLERSGLHFPEKKEPTLKPESSRRWPVRRWYTTTAITTLITTTLCYKTKPIPWVRQKWKG